jgi:hypothetical protein
MFFPLLKKLRVASNSAYRATFPDPANDPELISVEAQSILHPNLRAIDDGEFLVRWRDEPNLPTASRTREYIALLHPMRTNP